MSKKKDESSKKKMEVKEEMEYSKAVGYLEALVSSYKEGNIVVARNGESIKLTPQDFVELELKAKQKEGRETISLSLSWEIATDDECKEKKPPLKISSHEPVKEPVASVVFGADIDD